ncbi:MAG: serine hydrolase [bacterium]
MHRTDGHAWWWRGGGGPCLALLVGWLWPAVLPAATVLELDAAISNAVDSCFAFATGANAGKPGGIVGVALNGELIFQRAYGRADVAAGKPNSITAPFYLASCSKQFTAMCILLCQEKGLLAVTDEVRRHLPELDPAFTGVTIQHMLNMISAIYDTGTGNQTNTAAGMLAGLLQEGPYGIVGAEKPIGSTMKYCNMNYVLLALIVERVSGKTLRQFAREEIFEKLGMSDTDIRDDPAMVVTNQPNGYTASLTVWSTASSNAPATGSTGVSSTLADLLKWHENFYTNKLGQQLPGLIHDMETPGRYTSGPNQGMLVSNLGLGLPSYACGLMPDTYSGQAEVWHTGRWMGFKTATARYPGLHLSVFVLLNRDDQFPPFQSVANVFFQNVRFARPPPSATAQQDTPYTHTYSASGAPAPTFSMDSGLLPPGLTLTPGGLLTGTPTTPGDFSGMVKATSGTHSHTQSFAIHVDPRTPRLTGFTQAHGTVSFDVGNLSTAATHVVLRSEDLLAPQWTTVATFTATATFTNWSEPVNPQKPQLFYRIVSR